MQVYTDSDGPFNIVIVTEPPCAGEKFRHSEVCNHRPEDFARASQWVHGLMRMIGQDKPTASHIVDAYIEPATCRRPMTGEIKSMLSQEEIRRNEESLNAEIH